MSLAYPEEIAMTRTAICSCGYTFSYRDDAEYYGLVRRHIIPWSVRNTILS